MFTLLCTISSTVIRLYIFSSFSPRLPKSGETIIGNRYEIKYGGKGANQCIAASKLGAATAIIASVWVLVCSVL